MTPLERLKNPEAEPGSWRNQDRVSVRRSDLAKLLAVAEAAGSIVRNGFNGRTFGHIEEGWSALTTEER